MTVLGSLLGGLPFVADHIDLLAVGLVVVSVLPIVVTALRRSRAARVEKAATATSLTTTTTTDEEAVGDRS